MTSKHVSLRKWPQDNSRRTSSEPQTFKNLQKKFTFLVKNKSLNNVKTVTMVSMVKQEILSSSNEKPTDHGTNSDIHLN